MNSSTALSLPEKIERVLIKGDLKSLSDEERVIYHTKVCESVGLNALTKPFEYIELNHKLVLYATKACTDQLRSIHKISIEIVSREKVGDVYVVTARAKGIDGRTDESTGAVALGKAFGDNLANLYMKAETKAKRRVTLSIVGLGLLDESEVESIPGAPRDPFTPKPVAQIEERSQATANAQAETPLFKDSDDELSISAIQMNNEAPGERIIEYGKKYAGKKFKEFSHEQIRSYVDWMKSEGKDQSDSGKKFIRDAEAYLSEDVPF